ncbi:MAG: hypothetical protein ACD_62C00547G0011 [uncultured bacterium]|nr:MAG: hypothetical protein ACD_62C00547G0011 [uncultured bacterium]
MQDQLTTIDQSSLPRHIAIIMDGNGRWAKGRGLPRIEGHRRGVAVVEEIVEEARERGVKFLTLYAFSKENWNRPSEETTALMQLLYEFLVTKKEKMLRQGIRLNAIGDLKQLPDVVWQCLDGTMKETSGGQDMVLTLALSYGSRNEITRAVQKLAGQLSEKRLSVEQVSEELLASFLDTQGLPDPDLIIRTSGESRISNFLLWQGAYSELIFLKFCWPDFTREHFVQCLLDYQSRERRFGMTSEQLD